MTINIGETTAKQAICAGFAEWMRANSKYVIELDGMMVRVMNREGIHGRRLVTVWFYDDYATLWVNGSYDYSYSDPQMFDALLVHITVVLNPWRNLWDSIKEWFRWVLTIPST